MIGTAAKVDITKMRLALRSYKAATQKKEPEIINRFAKNAAFQAAHFTAIASPAKIKADLMRDPHLRYALTSLLLKKLGAQKLTKNQIKYNTLNRLAKAGTSAKGEFQKAVDAFVKRRQSSARYLRAGWAKAVEDLGGTFRGAKFKGAQGFANKATLNRVLAQVVNIVSEPDSRRQAGAEAIGRDAINKGINAALDDMLNYATNELAKLAREHSG